MNAAILNIGNELLQGFTVNTNATWLARELTTHSIEVNEILVIKDDVGCIVNTIKTMIAGDYDYIFVTGGLGPTHDDITRDAISSAFNSSSHLDGIHNKYGTADGVYVEFENSKFFFLPGVPREFKQMVVDEIIPKHFKKIKNVNGIITFNTFKIFESKLAELLNPILSNYSDCYEFSFLPDYTGVKFRAKKIAGNSFNKEREFILSTKKLIGEYLYSMDGTTLEQVVAKILTDNKMTISVAESCTGGSISKRLTDLDGSSKYFMGGLVAYSNNIKVQELEVPQDVINKCGAVSREVCSKMAEGVKKKFNSDIGVSCTGISGPSGGTKDKPVGLVYVAITIGNHTLTERYVLVNDRLVHRRMTSQLVLNLVRLALSK